MVDDSPSAMAALAAGTVPFGLERYTDRDGRPLLLRRQVILTGENLQDAQPGRDQQSQQPSVNLTLDSKGRSAEHTSELQSLMSISYAVFCLKKKKENQNQL